MITIRNVSKAYKKVQALDNINIEINDGEIFGIVGQSGAGKSTLLRTLNQLEKIDGGEIIIDGVDVTKVNNKQLNELRKNMGMIFQHFSLIEHKNVFKNIALPLECLHYKKEDIKKRVVELASLVGIEDKLYDRPRMLSGGQKQRVAIARSLACNPKFLLCDEATSALDPLTTKSILSLIKDINKKLGITVIVVTHQMEVVKEICQRIVVMEHGKVLEIGETSSLFLSSHSALKTIVVNEDDLLPHNGHNIRLLFPKDNSSEALITKMARELMVDFSIVGGKLEKFGDDVLGSLTINVTEEDFSKIKDYLVKKKVLWEVIENVK